MRHFSTLLFAFIFMASVAFAWDNVRVQTSDGMAVNATNPLPVTFGTGNQTIAGNVYIGGDIEVSGNTLITSGNVGIGTTSAGHALEVAGDIYATGDIAGDTLTAGGTSGASRIDFSANNTYLESLGIGGIYLGDLNAANTTSLYVDGWIYADNNIGVGTTSPAASLQVGTGTPYPMSRPDGSIYVSKDIEVNGAIYIGNISKATSALAIASRGAGTNPIHVNASDGSTLFQLAERTTGEGLLYVYDAAGNANLLLSARSSIASFFTNNVGIGTGLPTTLLAVSTGAADYTNVGAGDVYFKNDLEVDGQLYILNATTAGKALCITNIGHLGYCKDQPGATGSCSCIGK